MKNTFNFIKGLVGDITKQDLNYVDYYGQEDFAIFIPTVGYCNYAITKGHTHPSYSFIIYFGDSLFESNIKVKENEYIVQSIYPDFPHEEKVEEKFTRYIAIMISKELYEKEYLCYKEQLEIYDIKTFKINKEIMIYIEKYINEYDNCNVNSRKILKSIMNIIINELIRSQLNKINDISTYTLSNDLDNVINYMHQNYDEKITIYKLASICNMSKTSFINIFKEKTTYSPIDYLINIRIKKAKKLLRSNTKSITEIAIDCGFNSLSHFSACFHKRTGINPKDYLNNYK